MSGQNRKLAAVLTCVAGGVIGAAYAVACLFAADRVMDIDDSTSMLIILAGPVIGLIGGMIVSYALLPFPVRTKLLVILAPGVLLASTLFLPNKRQGPSDAALITTFRDKRATFTRIADTLSQGRDPSPHDLKAIGCIDFFRQPYPPHEAFMATWSWGSGHMFAPMDYKGFAYCKAPLKSLNNQVSDDADNDRTNFLPLGGHWYIYYKELGN